VTAAVACGAADGDHAADAFALERVAVEFDVDALVEGQLQAGGDQGAEVAFEVLYPDAFVMVGRRASLRAAGSARPG